MSEFWNAARQALPRGQQISLTQIAELQRRKDAEQARQDQLAAQSFMQMMQGKRFDQDQQQIDQSQQNWDQTRQDNTYNNQQDDVYRDTAFRMNLENQLKQNNFEQQRINQAGAQNADNLTQAELQAEWFRQLSPEDQANAMRVRFGLQPKAGTAKPTDPIERLKYGTDFATKKYDADWMRFKDQPNAFDSLRNVGMGEYDSTMAASRPQPQGQMQLQGQQQQSNAYLDQIIESLTPEEIRAILSGN